MNERLARAIGVWIIAFSLALVGLPLIAYIGGYLVEHGFVIVLAAVLATFLGILEVITS